jgi:hypothetical protein
LAESRRPERETTMPSGMESMLPATIEFRGAEASVARAQRGHAGLSAFG